MKKLLATTLLLGSLIITSCQADTFKSADAKAKLEKENYTVKTYTEEEAKAAFTEFSYENVTFTDALLASKGENKELDFIVIFYFKNNEEASNFMYLDGNKNLAIMKNYVDNSLGKNIKEKIGTHNNALYFGSETAYNIALYK